MPLRRRRRSTVPWIAGSLTSAMRPNDTARGILRLPFRRMHMVPRLYRVDHAPTIRHDRGRMAVAVPYVLTGIWDSRRIINHLPVMSAGLTGILKSELVSEVVCRAERNHTPRVLTMSLGQETRPMHDRVAKHPITATESTREGRLKG
jgi:hypothetical protein